MTELKKAITAIASDGLTGAAYGSITGMVIMSLRNPRALRPLTQCAGRCARDFSASFAAWSGIEHIMRGIRGKDDLTSAMVSASGASLAYSFVSQGLKVKPAQTLTWAASFAVASGAVYKVAETIRARSEHSTSTRDDAFDT